MTTLTSNSEIGEVIKWLRKLQDKTQRELAKEVGVTETYLSMIECGRRSIPDRTLLKVANAFGIAPLWIRCLATSREDIENFKGNGARLLDQIKDLISERMKLDFEPN